MKAFVDFMIGDWYIFIPMFGMSVTGITLLIWRLLLNINSTTSASQIAPSFTWGK